MVNLKLTVLDKCDYKYVDDFANFALDNGYSVTCVDNGNFVFSKPERDGGK